MTSAAIPAKINPLVPVELVIDHSIQVDSFAERLAFQKNAALEFERNHERYAFLQLGPDRVRRLLGGAAEHRHLPSGEPRVPRARGRVARRAGLPGHARRHRLAHHDGQRPRRARLGRRRHRGGGRDARPARVDAAPAASSDSSVEGELPEGSTATDLVLTVAEHAARARRRRQLRRVLRARPRQPAARRPRDAREHVARVRLDLRDLPGRRRDPALPRVLRPARRPDRARRGLHPRAGPLPRGVDNEDASTPTPSSSTSRPSSPASRARSGRRTASRCRTPRPTSSPSSPIRRTARTATTAATGRASRSRPATRPPRWPVRTTARTTGRPLTTTAPRPRRRRSRSAAGDDERRGVRARGRRRRDRRDHELHQHLEPLGHARRRHPRPQRGRARPDAQAVGQDQPRAGLEGRDRLPRPGRPDRSRWSTLGFRPRRLRLHDLHRQLRPAAAGDLRGDQRRGSDGLLGALGQPQLRGPDPPRGEDELPRLAAALRRLRAGRPDGPRHRQGPARRGRRRRAGVPARHLAVAAGGERGDRVGDRVRHVPQELRRGLRGRRGLAGDRHARGRPLRVGRGLDLRQAPAVLRGHAGRPARGLRRDQGRQGDRQARRQRHDRPHLAGRGDQEGHARAASTCSTTGSSTRTSTATAHAAATTR